MTTVTSGTSMISVRDLHKTYRHGGVEVHALRGVDLDVAPGSILALTGRSGAGKSTLLNLVAGLLRADRGDIEVDGVDVTGAGDAQLIALRRDLLGVIYQEFALLPLLTAEENVGLPLRITRTDPKQRDRTVAELLDRVGLTPHARQRPDEMSGGQQQRVAIARALANRPKVLLADEPTGQLDSETGAQVMALLRELVDEQGTTAVVATHDEAVAAFADDVVHLADGSVAVPGTPPADAPAASPEPLDGYRGSHAGETTGRDPADDLQHDVGAGGADELGEPGAGLPRHRRPQ